MRVATALLRCCRPDVALLKDAPPELAFNAGATVRVDGAPLGVAHVRGKKQGVCVSRLKRAGPLLSLRPRLYLLDDRGMVVGSVVCNRTAAISLSLCDRWEFSRPLAYVHVVEGGEVVVPVDKELMRAMERLVAWW